MSRGAGNWLAAAASALLGQPEADGQRVTGKMAGLSHRQPGV